MGKICCCVANCKSKYTADNNCTFFRIPSDSSGYQIRNTVNYCGEKCRKAAKTDAFLALNCISNDIGYRLFIYLRVLIKDDTLAPFKIKFNRMSKPNSLNRSISAETDQDIDLASPKDPTGSTALEEGNESITTEDSYNADVSSSISNNTNDATNLNNPNNNDRDGGREVIPSSPPPSYEFVLEETRLRQQESVQSRSPTTPPRAPEIMHKSSKEFYKAVAKQFGITCKMSDHCRCYDCQSHYFDCEYEQNEQEKTDGGLGAGTPVFLNEVMHGTACNIL